MKNKGLDGMIEKPAVFDRREEQALTCEVSDEALEAAAAPASVKAAPMSFSFCTSFYTCPWW
jgi:hypothetical protein